MKRFRWLAAIVVGLLLGGGIAYASIPGPDGTIHACYKTSNPAQGALIAIDSAASCPSGYTALNWNQTGPAGPTGATGATGPQGPPGVSGAIVRGGSVGTIAADGTVLATASCNSGEIALSAGFNYDSSESPPATWTVNGLYPLGGVIGTTWALAGFGGRPGDAITVLVICATVAS